MLGSDLLGHLYSHLETMTTGLTTPSREDRSTALTRPCFTLAELCYNHLWLQNVPSPKRKPVPISSHLPQHLTTRNPLSVWIGLFWTLPTSGLTPCASCVCCSPERRVLRACPRGSECQGFPPFRG